ncbi:hypothetical protein [Metabacillus fastidiosus]|uniref:hypothetical protein n=1 Tax=Metabacillus fastidiosus TaxID=1458 RepID=UPI0008269D5A|nr:hypothetical protein [Metabacillus fastidiosus]MED4461844.1 HNH endonuclease [Metabacillus fastidiosus]
MNHVILQPSGGVGKENFDNTIKGSVNLDRIIPFLDKKDIDLISSCYEDRLVPIWGVTPAKDGSNEKHWEKIKAGDIALFTTNMRIFASGVVTHKFYSPQLALELWGWKEDGVTWEYVYLLDEIQELDIPVQQLNETVGYSRENSVRRFTVLDKEKSGRIFERFNFGSEVYYPHVSEEEYKEVVINIDPTKPLDSKSMSLRRTEQSFLRKYLFKNKKTSCCGICHKEMPVEFLVAAHIKKRAKCTDEEKLDYKNIVMPMCKFGCDELYEKGYIGVKNGKVVRLRKNSLTQHILDYIGQVEGNECNYWHDKTVKYFDWHFYNKK